MAKLTPYIKCGDARAQAAFYTEALGGEILSIVTHGQAFLNSPEATKEKVMHMHLVVGGFNLFMTDFAHGPLNHGNGMSLSLEFATEAEAQAAFAKLAAGGTVLHPLEPSFWGALFGDVTDKYGVSWMITNEVKASQA